MLKLHEYEAKTIFKKFGIPVPRGNVFESVGELNSIDFPVVVKPQGIKGRGKIGSIIFANNLIEAKEALSKLLNSEIKGEIIRQVLIEERIDVQKEIYVAIAIDFSKRRPVLIVSSDGGVDIEETAEKSPDKIRKTYSDISKVLKEEDIRNLAEFLGSNEKFEDIVIKLWKIFKDYDAELVEINPLALTKSGDFIALDAVLNVNDDSLFRHPDLEKIRKREYKNDLERIADEMKWTYIDLDGNIGILSSGAGLTMAILDLIKIYGGSPANFLDTAQMDADGIYKAFELLSKKQGLKVILVNIFAGLNRCDDLAEGIKRYVSDYKPKTPIVVRMIGNREEEGKRILREVGIDAIPELEKAIEKSVEISKAVKWVF